MRNGYFRLVGAGPGFGLQIKAPTDGGESIRIIDVTEYLTQSNISCDLSALKKAISMNKDVVLPLGNGACPVVNLNYKLVIAEDYMKAVIRFYPPSATGKMLTVGDLLADLAARQVKYGIREDRIKEALEKGVYCTDIVVAEGTPPRHGKDAVIEYYFNTDLKARPTAKADGGVDFFNLNTINHCHAGDVLAKLIPADFGEYGTNIQGTRIKPREVKNAKLKYGNNIERSEDKTTLTSNVDGHVTLVDDRVFVSNVLQLENIDISTGNIEYDGSVNVTGNVQSNFTVKARGNIIVNGLVEGAYLEAGGDIIIARGMAGMNKGELKAEGNIVVKFLESAKASAGGYITAESILHSDVMAVGDITVDGKRGFITGGHVCSTNQINVKSLGSPMGTSTVVEVGANPVTKAKYVQMQKDVTEISKVLKSLEPIIASYAKKRKQGAQLSDEQKKYLTSILKLREQKMSELEYTTKELDALQEIIEQQGHAQVVVKGEVFPGAKIVIGEVSMVVQSNMEYCRFVKKHGDVKMVGM